MLCFGCLTSYIKENEITNKMLITKVILTNDLSAMHGGTKSPCSPKLSGGCWQMTWSYISVARLNVASDTKPKITSSIHE